MEMQVLSSLWFRRELQDRRSDCLFGHYNCLYIFYCLTQCSCRRIASYNAYKLTGDSISQQKQTDQETITLLQICLHLFSYLIMFFPCTYLYAMILWCPMSYVMPVSFLFIRKHWWINKHYVSFIWKSPYFTSF